MKRFLISRLSALGDTVCSLPAAVALKRQFPDCHITWVVDPRFAGIVECCAAVDEVVRWKPSWKTIPKYAERFDAALDLQGLLKSAAAIARAKADVKVGYHWQREGAGLFSSAVKPDPSSFHVVDQYVDVARALGATMARAEFDLKPKYEVTTAVRLKLKERGAFGKIAVLNAGAGWATKRWPPSFFAQVCDAVRELGVTPVLIGGGGEADRAAANEVISLCKLAPTNMLGETTVSELVSLINLSSVHVGGDTGSTHIAAALEKSAVGLYSITKPERSCPYGQIDHCHHDPRGLSYIEPAAVLETVRQIIN